MRPTSASPGAAGQVISSGAPGARPSSGCSARASGSPPVAPYKVTSARAAGREKRASSLRAFTSTLALSIWISSRGATTVSKVSGLSLRWPWRVTTT